MSLHIAVPPWLDCVRGIVLEKKGLRGWTLPRHGATLEVTVPHLHIPMTVPIIGKDWRILTRPFVDKPIVADIFRVPGLWEIGPRVLRLYPVSICLGTYSKSPRGGSEACQMLPPSCLLHDPRPED